MSNKKTSTNVPQGSTLPKKTSTVTKNTPAQGSSKPSALMNAKHVQPNPKVQVQHGKQHSQAPNSPEKRPSPSQQSESSPLMQMLFAASEKQKVAQQSHTPRTRKSTAPTLDYSSAYAGASFDRAPTGDSFPIPSFLSKSSAASPGDELLSASCPLPSGPMSKRTVQESQSIKAAPVSNQPVLKTLYIHDLLGSSSQPSTPSKPSSDKSTVKSSSPSPPSKAINVAANQSKQRELNDLTQDLRRMLNLSK